MKSLNINIDNFHIMILRWIMFTTLITFLQQFLFVSFIKTQAFKKQLTPQEENDLLEKYFQGDQEARNQLIEQDVYKRQVLH